LALAKKLSQVPEKSILLLEDVDAAFTSRSEVTDSNKLQPPSHLASGIIYAWLITYFGNFVFGFIITLVA